LSTLFADNATHNGNVEQRLSFSGGILANTPCWNLSHRRGTDMKDGGLGAVQVFAQKVSSDSAKKMGVAVTSDAHSTQARSKICASGR
jgi:hypothetical protein